MQCLLKLQEVTVCLLWTPHPLASSMLWFEAMCMSVFSAMPHTLMHIYMLWQPLSVLWQPLPAQSASDNAQQQ